MKTAFVFPGQGSQSLGMQAELAEAFPVVRRTYEEAGEALGRDLWRLSREGPEEELGLTVNTQPLMLTAGVAAWRVWEERGGPAPAWLAGHSLGEYTALVAAGAVPFIAAVTLVAARARFMQEAVAEGGGAMAAILGLDDDAVRAACEQAAPAGVVEAVNYNAPGQVVIAGEKPAVERAVEAAKESGARRAMLLPVSVPSHCALMRPAAERLRAALEDVSVDPPAIPVVNNVDVAVESDPAAVADALVRQLYSPVRWVETVQRFAAEGADRVVECGPGKVLAGLGRRIDRSLPHAALDTPAVLDALLEEEV
ncbi:ACP S-malonyltransferase [Lentisalinibacter sediminis]|uniref:ACP S-malonyltransferase n=1 Tax=Lentisalinibacter sediminis TaxID=2992237 RepID=UPI00386E33BC